MKFGYECVKPMCDELLAFMEKHKFRDAGRLQGPQPGLLHDARRTRADAVRQEGRAKAAVAAEQQKKMVLADSEWSGDSFVQQSDALARG